MQQGSKAELWIQDALLMNRTSDCWLIRIFLFLKDCRVRSWYLAQNPADGFVPEWGIPADLGVSWCIQFYPKKLRRCFHFQPVFFVTLRLEDIEQHVRNREEKERRILFDRQSATAAKSLRRGMFFSSGRRVVWCHCFWEGGGSKMVGMHGQTDISYVLTLGTSPPLRIPIYVLNLDSIRRDFSDCWISMRLIVAYPPYIPYNWMFLGGPLDLPLVPRISGSVFHGIPMDNRIPQQYSQEIIKNPMFDHHFPIFSAWPSNLGPHLDKTCQVWNCHFPQAHPWLASRRYARAWLVAGRFKNSRGLRHGSRCTACGEMIDFVSPFGRPKDRLDANNKRDRKRKLHYVTLFSSIFWNWKDESH